MVFLALRLVGAAALLVPWALTGPPDQRRGRIIPGILVGSCLFAGFAFQIFGLQRVTPTNSAFVTALSVILVPLCVVPIRRRMPAPTAWAGVLLATTGLYFLLRGPEGFRFTAGDTMTLGCALMFALHIIGVDAFARKEPYRHFAMMQVATAGILATAAVFIVEDPVLRPGPGLFAAVAWTAAICTAVAFALQTSMQRYTTPTRVAIIYATEPVFAALFSLFFYGEPLGLRDIFGGGLIFGGILIAEFRPASPQNNSNK
jgi:drug/metabolite transporter (DMT)-like permease